MLNNEKEISSNKPSIKILVGYHKPAVLLKDEILTPIHLGRVLATQASKDGELSKEDYEWMCENMIGDDTGDNISHLNRYFCELTGIYWAWKNYDKLGNPDYIGFMHYRRQFVFDEIGKCNKFWLNYAPIYEYADNTYKNSVKINPNDIYDYSLIIPKEFAYKNITKSSRLRDAYLTYMDSDRALLMIEQIAMNDPKCKVYKRYANKFYTLNKSYICNMFIMKKELFFEYCEFLFYVLFKIYEKIKDDFQSGILSINRERELAFAGEYITDIFIRFAKKQTKSYKELNVSFLKHTEVITSKIKQTNKNTVNICYYCDLGSFEYLYISIQSILENSDKEKNYCVFILERDIKKYNKTKILALQNHNFSIFFIDLNAIIYQIVSEFHIDAKKNKQ